MNQDIQQEWQQLQMQGSDLEKVERKFAEIEFSKREKEKTIFQNYSHIQSKLENGSESAFDLIPMAGQLVEIQKELKQQKQLEARLAKLHGRLDNYYRLRGPSDAMANSTANCRAYAKTNCRAVCRTDT